MGGLESAQPSLEKLAMVVRLREAMLARGAVGSERAVSAFALYLTEYWQSTGVLSAFLSSLDGLSADEMAGSLSPPPPPLIPPLLPPSPRVLEHCTKGGERRDVWRGDGELAPRIHSARRARRTQDGPALTSDSKMSEAPASLRRLFVRNAAISFSSNRVAADVTPDLVAPTMTVVRSSRGGKKERPTLRPSAPRRRWRPLQPPRSG